jgi:hypothetical protein
MYGSNDSDNSNRVEIEKLIRNGKEKINKQTFFGIFRESYLTSAIDDFEVAFKMAFLDKNYVSALEIVDHLISGYQKLGSIEDMLMAEERKINIYRLLGDNKRALDQYDHLIQHIKTSIKYIDRDPVAWIVKLYKKKLELMDHTEDSNCLSAYIDFYQNYCESMDQTFVKTFEKAKYAKRIVDLYLSGSGLFDQIDCIIKYNHAIIEIYNGRSYLQEEHVVCDTLLNIYKLVTNDNNGYKMKNLLERQCATYPSFEGSVQHIFIGKLIDAIVSNDIDEFTNEIMKFEKTAKLSNNMMIILLAIKNSILIDEINLQ